jgi:hypothetical protein
LSDLFVYLPLAKFVEKDCEGFALSVDVSDEGQC